MRQFVKHGSDLRREGALDGHLSGAESVTMQIDSDAIFISKGVSMLIFDEEEGAWKEIGSLVGMKGEVDGKPIVVIPEEEM